MVKSPFYRVSIDHSGRDITDMIDSFTFEDCTEEDDILKIQLKGKNPSIIDDPDFSEDIVLKFIFGYLDGNQSGIHTAKISDIGYRYGTTIDMNITASDLGRDMKLTESNKIWKNVSTSDIINQIATKYKMQVNIEGTTRKYTSIPQGNMSDFDFIKYLASIEPNNYIYFVKGKTINFVRRKIAQASSGIYTLGDPEGGVLGFSVTVKKDKKNSGSGETKTTGINPDTLENVEGKSNTTTDKTGRYVYDQNSNLITDTNTGKTLSGVVAQSNADAKAITDKAKADAELEGITASVELEGNCLFLANTTITMSGVAKKHSGNWYVPKVTHKIDRSGYKSIGDLKKNATSQDVSNPDGQEANANKIYVYDQNANPVK